MISYEDDEKNAVELLSENQSAGENPVSIIDGYAAAWDLATSHEYGDTLTNTIMLNQRVKGITGGPMITPEQVQEKYPFIQEKFKEDVPESRALYLNDIEKKRYELQKTKDAAFGGSVFQFLAADLPVGIAASFTDPIELGINAVTGFTFGAAKSAAIQLGKKTAAEIAELTAKQSLKSKIAFEVAENTVASLGTEAINFQQQQDLQRDYGAIDMGVNIAVGGGAYTALKYTAKGIKGIHSKVSSKIRVKDEIERITRIQNDLPTENIHEAKSIEQLNTKSKNPVQWDEESINHVHSEWTPQTKESLYMAVDDINGKSINFGDEIPNSSSVTDVPDIANKLGNGDFSEGGVTVYRLDANELNILDADSVEEFSGFKETESHDFKYKEELENSTTFNELIQNVREGISSGKYTNEDFEALITNIKNIGFDGIKRTVSESDTPHHQVQIFDEAIPKLKEKAFFNPDPENFVDLGQKYANDLQTKMDSPIDQEAEIINKEAKSVVPLSKDEEFIKVQKLQDESMELVGDMDKNEGLSQQSKEKYEELKLSVKEDEAIDKALESLISCYGGAIK